MKTCLYDRHVLLGAKIVPFAGWEMPIQYKGIITEHHAVRNAVGLFDVSHMGRIAIEGIDAEKLLDYLSTNQIANKVDGTATYTVWCHENGGSVDDLLVYRKNKNSFFVVVNASNRDKDLNHLKQFSSNYQVNILPKYSVEGILALQGPKAEALLEQFFPEVKQIKPMHFVCVEDEGRELIISRTGYTGAGGFELYTSSSDQTIKWWDHLLEAGKEWGIEPVGLGARDTLRLEMGYALYGHELSNTISPIESVAAWTVKANKEFVGKEALLQLEKSPDKRFAYGIELLDKGIGREGYHVYQEGNQLGIITSGTFSPTLNKSIALILVNKSLKPQDRVEIAIRQQLVKAQVVPVPFL